MYQNPFTERFLVIAEKPSVARTIAQVLACEDKKDGYLEGPDGENCGLPCRHNPNFKGDKADALDIEDEDEAESLAIELLKAVFSVLTDVIENGE